MLVETELEGHWSTQSCLFSLSSVSLAYISASVKQPEKVVLNMDDEQPDLAFSTISLSFVGNIW